MQQLEILRLVNQSGQINPKKLLSIGQVTALTGVRKSTIRHWEREFDDFLQSVRTDGNQRRFTPDSVQKIEKIKELVHAQGLTLRGARLKIEASQTAALAREQSDNSPPESSIQKLVDLMSEHVIRRLFHDR